MGDGGCQWVYQSGYPLLEKVNLFIFMTPPEGSSEDGHPKNAWTLVLSHMQLQI